MDLAAGTRLGPYEIVAPIGRGGMGEVYRARDTTLNREVALKLLPDAFRSGPERFARFTREAQTLAALNHPQIAHVHGLEDSTHGRALMMELVEGEALARRIAPTGDASSGRGLPLDDALALARQIAEALQAAHEKGIVDRDPKPANIMVTADGQVKVLDFGLAKAIDPAGGDAMNSPTSTLAATRLGVVLGTAAYVSPDYLAGWTAFSDDRGERGRSADGRWCDGHRGHELVRGAESARAGEPVTHTSP
jgi:serine/threonine protein kinase